MLTYIAGAFRELAVITGFASAGFWWWLAHLQAGRNIGKNPGLIKLDRKVVRINGRAAALIGASIAAHAIATILSRF